MKQNDVRPMAGFVLGAAVLCGFVLTLLSMSMCALAVLMGKLPAEQYRPLGRSLSGRGQPVRCIFCSTACTSLSALMGVGGRWTAVWLSGSLESRVVW